MLSYKPCKAITIVGKPGDYLVKYSRPVRKRRGKLKGKMAYTVVAHGYFPTIYHCTEWAVRRVGTFKKTEDIKILIKNEKKIIGILVKLAKMLDVNLDSCRMLGGKFIRQQMEELKDVSES